VRAWESNSSYAGVVSSTERGLVTTLRRANSRFAISSSSIKIMKAKRKTAGNIDEYIAGFPAEVRKILEKIRATIRKAAPDAKEKISYSMPALAQDGILVYFAAFKKHIGLFPPVKGDRELMNAVAPYAGPKGNLQFPLDAPIPYALIGKIVKLRVKEKKERANARMKNK
jgi:uncharacterized protein YdhG (YjbR/CyaY superfamily)